MRVDVLLVVLGLALPVLSATTTAATAAESSIAAFSVPELMRATALDTVFDQFASAIAASARTGDISRDEIFLSHWEATAAGTFNGPALRSRLATALEGKFTDAERAVLGEFFRSEFGRRISALERRVAELDVAGQGVALREGKRLADEVGVVRATQLDDLMELTGAAISAQMAGQSMRALLVGMSVSHQRGDIEVPWQEIDAQVAAMMPGLILDHGRAQRAMMAYAYRDLSDEDLEGYVAFLRTEPAQKLYAIAAFAVGEIVARSMSSFGETLAARMASVNV